MDQQQLHMKFEEIEGDAGIKMTTRRGDELAIWHWRGELLLLEVAGEQIEITKDEAVDISGGIFGVAMIVSAKQGEKHAAVPGEDIPSAEPEGGEAQGS